MLVLNVSLLAASVPGRLRVCSTNPRYMVTTTDTTKTIFIAGAHTWLTYQDAGNAPNMAGVPPFNWQGFLDFNSTIHMNFQRLFFWEQTWLGTWTASTNYRIGQSAYTRNGATTAQDGEPKFDLNVFNQAFFDRLVARVDSFAAYGVYCLVEPFNGWSHSSKGQVTNVFRGHPFNSANNVQSAGFTDNNGGNAELVPADGGDATIWSYQIAYLKKIIDELHTRDNVVWGVCNEPEGSGNQINWMRAIVDTIKNYETRLYGNRHLIQIGVQYPNGSDAALWSPLTHSDAVSVTTDYSGSVLADTSKLVFTDTDHICGNCKDGDWVYKSFCNGTGAILFMDGWDGRNNFGVGPTSGWDSSAVAWVSGRKACGQVQLLANHMNLVDMRPTPSIASTGYCLSGNKKWIVYQPAGNNFTVNVSSTTDSLNVNWVNIANGTTQTGAKIAGGSSNQTFIPPSGNHQVLYLFADEATVPAVPDAPALIIPSNGTTNELPTLLLVWHRSYSATTYRLQVSSDSLFISSMLVDDSTLADTAHQLANLSAPLTYYWRVKARNGAGASAWSEQWQFTTALEVTQQYLVSSAWNLISLPLSVFDNRTTSLFPTSTSDAFAFEHGVGYVPRDTLLSRIGYWLRFDSTQEINVTGIPHRQDTIDVDAGWNLIGSVYGQIDTAASVTIPPAIRISNFFEYTTGYEAASTIRGGRGYWVKTTAAGKIVLPSSSRLEGPKR